ncbi:uracil-DNA glycosylase [Candidatus Curculioniphilus buchneri]|uniref:uracil-DNA glycosylase n=1 Tax=Candidatus Curculioniphilus buchneri TaxID=690594 RepID=UPI00376EBC64
MIQQIITWQSTLAQEKVQPYFRNILTLVAKERASCISIYPEKKDVFNAFRFTELSAVKVVILGQDPYHGYNQAHGLSFSVKPNIPIPPSLVNIYTELSNDIENFIIPEHGYLKSWAEQGVMLLNCILTVKEGQAHSHAHLGWEKFTDKVLQIINTYRTGVVFLLWGAQAQKKKIIIDQKRHYILQAPHPSPLSVHHGFFGCHHFSKANTLLEKQGKKPIDWTALTLPINVIKNE